jgi:hypothetical protein
MMELQELAKSVPQPEKATHYDGLIPRHICQKFRANVPVRCLRPSAGSGRPAAS